MVRKKSDVSMRASSFAPPGKIMLIERNKTSTPMKTPLRPPRSPSVPASSIKKTKSKQDHSKSYSKRKLKPGTKALREIRKFQNSTNLLIPKLSFFRLVKEILAHPGYRISSMALMALQEAAEMAMADLFEVSNLCCLHAHRVTLFPSDINLTRRAFGIGNPVNE